MNGLIPLLLEVFAAALLAYGVVRAWQEVWHRWRK